MTWTDAFWEEQLCNVAGVEEEEGCGTKRMAEGGWVARRTSVGLEDKI